MPFDNFTSFDVLPSGNITGRKSLRLEEYIEGACFTATTDSKVVSWGGSIGLTLYNLVTFNYGVAGSRTDSVTLGPDAARRYRARHMVPTWQLWDERTGWTSRKCNILELTCDPWTPVPPVSAKLNTVERDAGGGDYRREGACCP
jgi:hypothetical protein